MFATDSTDDGVVEHHDDVAAPSSGYFSETRKPLQALIFVAPLIALYEIGLIRYGTDQFQQVVLDIYARRMLGIFLQWFGIGGIALPGIIVVVVLLSMHVVRGDPWRCAPRHYLFMAAESLVLAMPLFVLSLILFRSSPHAQSMAASPGDALEDITLAGRFVFNLGAGIYEEMLFRLMALALLHFCLVDLLGMRERTGAFLAILVSALAFSGYHFDTTDGRLIEWRAFGFYTLAGLYFAGLYLVRGFGIAAGTHAVYDVLVELFQL